MIVEALGVSGVQSLWAPLMQLEATNARQLQWLAVLACWSALTNLHLAFHCSITPQQFPKQAQQQQQQKKCLFCPRSDTTMGCSTCNLRLFLVLSHVTQDTNDHLRPEVLQGQARSHRQRCYDQPDAAFDAFAGCQTQFTHLLQQIQPSITGSPLHHHHQ